MEDDWDLTAVVRGCSTAAATTTTTTTTKPTSTTSVFNSNYHHSVLSSFGQQSSFVSNSQTLHVLPLPDPIKPRSAIEELHDLYKPLFSKSHHQSPSLLSPQPQITTPPSFSSTPQPLHRHQQKQQAKLSVANPTPQRSKKRKNQLKKVCQVPAESLSSDVWAWRKYGQKPIKGSPYPRGYYRCSSSKGCMARKQVERSRSDPGMFVVTYTAEHNHPAPTHRNSLAGSTRNKLVSPVSVAGVDSTKPKGDSPTSLATSESVEEELIGGGGGGQSSTTTVEAKEEKQSPLAGEDETEYLGVCDTIVSDDFFVGLDGLAGDCFSDHSTARFGFPWGAATAASSI